MESNRLERLERQMRGLERDLHLLVKATAAAPPAHATPSTSHHSPTSDVVWSCVKCQSRLGLYDEQLDELRVRYKDFVAYVHVGVGGSVRVVCRGCGELNTLEYVGNDGHQPPTKKSTPVALKHR